MNWTGGRLTRAAHKADGSVVDKQKQHFAKVRNTLLRGAKKSPAKWSIFDSITINVKRGSSDRGDNTPIRPRDRSPSRQHHRSDHHNGGRKHPRDIDRPELHERSKIRRISPQVHDDRHDKVKIKKEAYEASAHKLYKTDVTDIDDEIEVLRRKKLKLLRDSDWLGLGLQEPLKLKYVPTTVDNNIGRRRRLKPGHEARYDKTRVRLSPARHQNYDVRSEVRVTIDGKERPVGVSSSAAPSKGAAPPISSQSTEAMLMDYASGRHDSEASNIPRANHETRHENPRRSDSHISKSRNHKSSTMSNKHGKDDIPPWEDLNCLAAEASRQPKLAGAAQPILSSSSIRKLAEARGIAMQDEAGDRSTSLFLSSHHSSSQGLPPLLPQRQMAQQGYNAAHVRNNGRLIMPSSPPVLHHPVPRKATSRILRTDSLEVASSAAATVGELPKLTKAEERGDKMWKDWLDEDAACGSDAEPGSDDEREQSSRRSITPGVSQYAPQRELSHASSSSSKSPSDAESTKSNASTRHSEASMPHNMMRLSSSAHSTSLSASRTPSIHNQALNKDRASSDSMGPFVQPQMIQQQLKQGTPPPLNQKVDDDTAWKTYLRSPSELRFDAQSSRPFEKPQIRWQPLKEKQKRKTPDPDAAWKSFVLTDDSDSEGENVAFGGFWKRNEKPPVAKTTNGRSAGQTMREGFFNTPQKLHAKAPLAQRQQSVFKRPVPFGAPHKAGKQSVADELDKKYEEEANRELRKELWKRPNGMRTDDREEERRRVKRQKKSIWDVPSSDGDYIEDM